jgi:cytochrome P450
MEHFAWPVVITVVCQFLGVPVEDRPTFGRWANTIMTVTKYPRSEVASAWGNLIDYMRDLVRRRCREPGEDFLTLLIRAHDEEDRLSEDEIAGYGLAVLVAGHATTGNQFGNFVYTLLMHPDKLADPGLLETAVEELSRFVPAAETDQIPRPRLATVDIEIGGVTIRAGECVFTDSLIAARDPSVFADPDELDLARPANPHFAFGHGIHHCIGAPLARLELRLGLGALLRRLPGIALAVDEPELEWVRDGLIRGVEKLPLTW